MVKAHVGERSHDRDRLDIQIQPMPIIPNTLMMLMEIDYLSTMGTSVTNMGCDAGDYMSFDFTEDAKHLYISVLNSTTFSMNGLHQYSFGTQQLTSISGEKGSVCRGFNNHMYVAPVNFDYIVDITTEKRILIEPGATGSGLLAVQPYKVVEYVKSRNEILAQRFIDRKSYKLKDHLGNVNSVPSDLKTSIIESDGKPSLFETKLNSLTNYYPFGMMIPGRKLLPENYRFGFNGKEMDNEVSGNGNQYDYGFRIYNPRIGRFLSVDPLSPDYPELTPFQYTSNSPIVNIDLDGLEAIMIHGTWSAPQTWNTVFSNNMLKATNWSSVQKEMLYATWSGSNSSGAREKAADKLYNWIVSDDNKFRDKKHVTLIGHSHGGNVNKMVKNKLEKEGWNVDIINVETPQRKDTQSDETGNGIYLNFYSYADLIQFLGTGSNESSEGARVDFKASENIELNTYVKQPGLQKLKKTVFAPVVYFGETLSNALSWLITQGAGHSLQQQKQSQDQIIDKTKSTFKDQTP